MKRFNYFLLIVLACFFVTRANAQVNIHLGATTAVNATFVLDKGLSEDPRYSSTYTYKWAPVGFNFGIDLGRKLSIFFQNKVKSIKCSLLLSRLKAKGRLI